MPADLATGCFVLRTRSPASATVSRRVTHAALNKDTGLIDPVTGQATDPTTPRGMVGDNFAQAVSGAIAETRRQWRDLRSELTARYGEDERQRPAPLVTTRSTTAAAPVGSGSWSVSWAAGWFWQGSP